jgi:hypothetical protein
MMPACGEEYCVPDRNTGCCLDPGLPGTAPQRRRGEGDGEADAGAGPPNGEGEDQLESGRDGGNIMEDKEELIQT